MFFVRLAKLATAVAFLGSGVYFAVSNTHEIMLRVPVTAQTVFVNASLALFFAFLLGVFLAVVFFGYEWFRKTLLVKRLQKQQIFPPPPVSSSDTELHEDL